MLVFYNTPLHLKSTCCFDLIFDNDVVIVKKLNLIIDIVDFMSDVVVDSWFGKWHIEENVD